MQKNGVAGLKSRVDSEDGSVIEVRDGCGVLDKSGASENGEKGMD